VFVDEGKAVAFKIGDSVWQCDLTSYECAQTDRNIDFPAADDSDNESTALRRRGQRQPAEESRAPDGDNSLMESGRLSLRSTTFSLDRAAKSDRRFN
jgi:hypothetical protein